MVVNCDEMKMFSIIFFFFIFCTMMSRMTSHPLHRHLLHQPLILPLDLPPPASPSPSLPPQPSQQPKYPFSSSSSSSSSSSPGSTNSGGGYPFFPSDPHSSPPPPPAATLASFPANISSLIFPNSPSSNRRFSAKLIATVVASISLSSLVLIIALALILHRRKTRQNAVVSHKPLRSESSQPSPLPTTMMTSDGSVKLPPLRRGVIGTSTEFLYLGTVANSQENEGVFCKPDSPELRPLPPLPRFNYFTSAEQVSSSRNVEEEDDDDDEEFFSPRGSSGTKESFNGSRKALRFDVAEQTFDNNGSRSCNSKTATFPYSNSCSPTISDHDPAFSLRSPSLSSSPEIELGRPTRASPDKFVNLPPPHPRPMPPPTFWETSVGPPEKMVVEAHQEDSGIDASGRNVQPHKLKLKPLHWDKVRTSSEKVMAWDQIKSSSFQ